MDFDGVLHPNHCGVDQLFCKVPLLQNAISDFNWKIVISTSWRCCYTLDEIRNFLIYSNGSLIAHRIVDVTYDSCSNTTGFRQREIEAYVERENIKDYIAIDDDISGFYTYTNLILCDGKIGITEKEIAQLIEFMEK